MMLKKWFMRQYWRLQQSQSIISMLFWINASTLLIWPYIRWRFDNQETFLGISMTYWGIISIAFIVMFFVMLIGWVYDHIFALWKDHRTVDTERNPFGTYATIPANTVIIGILNKILKEQTKDDKEVQETCDWIDEWLAWSSKQEIWARSQRFWDETFPEPVPDLFFMPEGSIQAARDVGKKLGD